MVQLLNQNIKKTEHNMTLIIEHYIPFLLEKKPTKISEILAVHQTKEGKLQLVGNVTLKNENSAITIWGSEDNEDNGMHIGEKIQLYARNNKGIYRLHGIYQEFSNTKSLEDVTYSKDAILILKSGVLKSL